LFILKFGCWNRNWRLLGMEGYMEWKTEIDLTWKMKKESTLKPTPLIEKMKPKLSPIFEKKRELEPNWNRHLESDASRNRWFPLEPENPALYTHKSTHYVFWNADFVLFPLYPLGIYREKIYKIKNPPDVYWFTSSRLAGIVSS